MKIPNLVEWTDLSRPCGDNRNEQTSKPEVNSRDVIRLSAYTYSFDRFIDEYTCSLSIRK